MNKQHIKKYLRMQITRFNCWGIKPLTITKSEGTDKISSSEGPHSTVCRNVGAYIVEQSTVDAQFLHFLSKHPLLAIVRDQPLIYIALWSVNSYVLHKGSALPVFM